ncbi:MAG: YbdK family carboxylate-amine ligase [Frankiales bacterium]|nr:YbdK family carboxylate-amine ligase [Frankiales bacterium]
MTDVGATIGVEEEYHLVDAETHALADAPAVVDEARLLLGADAQGEISTSQLEIATPVSTSLAEVRAHLVRLRRGADQAAQRHGCRILAAGTHPTATWHDQQMSDDDRYRRILDRLGLIALQQLIAGCHVHVAVPDPELAVHVLDRLRPDLPVLLALSGSSPYWEGVDSGYASYRTTWFARFPVTGSPEVLRSRTAYERLVADLVASGVVDDASHLYWDARVSTKYPTVELRMADTCPRVDDAVLQAGLARSLVRVAAAQAVAGTPFPQPRPELVKAARWGAARYGLEDRLMDLRAVERRPAGDVVRGLLARLRDDLEDAGEWDEVSALAEQALARGTSAAEQRLVLARTGDLAAVTRSLVDQVLIA